MTLLAQSNGPLEKLGVEVVTLVVVLLQGWFSKQRGARLKRIEAIVNSSDEEKFLGVKTPETTADADNQSKFKL